MSPCLLWASRLVHILSHSLTSHLPSDTCQQTGTNPTELFVELAALVEKCKQTVTVVEVDTTGAYNGVKTQVSNIVAEIILVSEFDRIYEI